MSNTLKTISGSLVSLITPFNSLGKIDYKSFDYLIDYHLKNGTKGFVLAGEVGEGEHLSYNEYRKLIRNAKNKVDSRVPIIAGINPDSPLKHIAWAMEENADAILVTNKFTWENKEKELLNLIDEIDLLTKTPLIIDNNPERTGYDIPVDMLERLARDVDQIIAINECWGGVKRIENLVGTMPSTVKVLSGNDEQALEAITKGAHGCISNVANIVPEEFWGVLEAVEEGVITKAYGHNSRTQKLVSILRNGDETSSIKTGLCMMGMIQEENRNAQETDSSIRYLIKEQLKMMDLVKPEAFSLIRAWI